MAEEDINVDQNFEVLSDNKNVIYDTDLLDPNDILGSEQTIGSLVDEFHTQNAIQMGQHCFVSSNQQPRSGGVVVETKDIQPAIASKLREGVLVYLEDPFMPTELSLNHEKGNFEFRPVASDENTGITHAMKKGDVTVLANCTPAQFF